MDGNAHTIDPARLVEHGDFIRRLSRSMLREPADAEDAAQQTFAAALGARLHRATSLRFWLSSTVRNFSKQIARGQIRRRRRDAAAARPEKLPSVSDVLEHEEMRSLVVQAVLRLEDSQRTVVLLRWFDGLSSRDIARRLSEPVETVRTRLKRATTTLRRDLDSHFGGDRRALALTLASLGRVPAEWALGAKTGTVASWMLMTTARKVVLLALGLLVAVTVTWSTRLSWWPDGGRSPVPGGDLSLATEDLRDREAGRRGVDVARIRPAPFVESGPAAELATEPESVVVSGTVTVIDLAGARHEQQDGTFRILLATPYEAPRAEVVETAKGRWRVSVPKGQVITCPRLNGARFGERAAALEFDAFTAAEGLALALEARWLPECKLHVVDRDTGQELLGIEAWDGYGSGSIPFQPGDPPSLTAVRSPVLLPPAFQVVQLWVRAEGHSWGSIAVDLESGGERYLSLARAAALSVALENHQPWARAKLRVRFPDDTFLSPSIIDLEPQEGVASVIERLPAGPCDVSVEIGSEHHDPNVLGSARVTLVEGQTTPVTLRLRDPRKFAPTVPLRGVLVVPKEWGNSTAKIVITPLSKESTGGNWKMSGGLACCIALDLPAAADDAPRPFDASRVAPGRYRVAIAPFQLEQLVEVTAGGENLLRLEVPPPAELAVSVLDAATGEDLANAGVAWNVVTAGHDFDGVFQFWPADPGTQRTTLRVPIGDVRIMGRCEGYQLTEDTVHVHAGRNLVDLRAVRSVEFRVRFMEGGTPVPMFAERARLAITAADGSPAEVHFGDQGVDVRVWVSRPGRYRVTAVAPAEYQAIWAREVDVSGSSSNETVLIPLSRSR